MSKVSIICFTFNHEPYIRQCLDGFVMQQTDFEFEAIIHDDASTDGTAAIILEYAQKYPNIIKPYIETENQYSKDRNFGRRFVDEHVNSPYIALCEGDDYWTDPKKLQMQVEYMDSHPGCGLCFTGIQNYDQATGHTYCSKPAYDATFEDLLFDNPIENLTVLRRRESTEGMTDFLEGKPFQGLDIAIHMYVATRWDIHYINKVTAVYRILQNSAQQRQGYESRKKFYEQILDIRTFYANRTGHDNLLPKMCQKHYSNLFKVAYGYREWDEMDRYYNMLERPVLKERIKYCVGVCRKWLNR